MNVPPHIREAVKHHLDVHTAAGPDSLLFPAAAGAHMRSQAFWKLWQPALKSSGRDGVRLLKT